MKLYRVGSNLVAKPNRKSRTRYNIEMGEDMYSVGVRVKHIKTTSFIGHHWICEAKHDELDEVSIMDDGKVFTSTTHRDN